MVYGYARVSTGRQAKEGTSLEAQESALRANGAAEIYSDSASAVSGEREGFNALLERLETGDTLIVTNMDRFARSLSDGIRLIDELMRRGITINILNLGTLSNDVAGRLIRNIFLAFAEFERDLFIERTQSGKAVARTKAGFKEGRPKKFTPEQLRHAVALLESHTYKEVEAMMKISKSTLQRAKRSYAAQKHKGER